ncbi:MAG: molecular chaperone DnaJ [Chloroflexota bacterium]|nr:molecular chaperone DnaJ [Chloroflexota bacterium]
MAEKRDYYEVLEIDRTATDVEIKRAYRKLARKYHPDINKDDGAEERFKEVNEAYEVLSNAERRAAYDRFGHAAAGAGAGAGDPFGGFAGSPFSDLFDSFFGGGAGAARQAPPRGSDIQVSVTLSFEEAVFGTEKDVEVDRLETCDVCNGSRMKDGKQPQTCASCGGTGEVRRVQQTILGQFMTSGPCPTCHGEGVIITDPCDACRGRGRRRQYRTIAVTVPAGVDDNATLRLTGQGEDAPGPNGQPGNLYVKVHVRPHKIFERHGKAIHSQVGINVAQAALGDEVEIQTIDGPVMFRIPSGTQSGQQFRLRGKGVPDLRGGARGDQIVTIQVVTPRELTDDQRALFEELAASLGSDIQQQPNSKGFFGRMKDAFAKV